MIKTEALTKFYGKSRGIENVNLTIKKGEIFGFIGPNGAGKSTTIRILLSLIYPTSGRAFINGIDCVRNSENIKQILGYTPSEVNYYDDMTVDDLLKYSARFYHRDCSQQAKKLSQRLELDLDKKIKSLSYGNKKKVAIIQSMQHEPKVLIFDEPTGGLDPLIQNIFFELLEEEKRKGTTILFSSHILSEVQRVCDRVAIIRDGNILEIESIDTLRNNNFKQIEIDSVCKREELIPLQNLNGISNYSEENDKIKFLYSGNINELLNLIVLINIKNINIAEPPLEDIFLHYYEKGASI